MIVPQKERRAIQKAKALQLLGSKCALCGSTDRLEFDHINRDREDRRHLIGQLVSGRWSRVLSELEKCQFLCRPCHIRKTLREQGFLEESTHGTLGMYNNHGCRCGLCKRVNTDRHRNYMRRMRAKKK